MSAALRFGLDSKPLPAARSKPAKLVLRSCCAYKLLKEIARGGMGVVYQARQINLDRTVAVKMMLDDPLATELDVHRFHTEAKAAARLQHPNIVAVHDLGEFDGRSYFSMDYVEGPSLAKLARTQPLAIERSARYVKIIAEAIDYAHRRGVLHRDLKPSNVLIDAFDQPRITDFGLAKLMDARQPKLEGASPVRRRLPQCTLAGAPLGSPSFMPPEQAAGRHKDVGPQSDVYSIGAILYYITTSRPPFLAQTVTATLRMVCEGRPRLPRTLNGNLPNALEAICLKCLEKDPSHRYPSARHLAADLGRFLGQRQ